MKLGAETKKLGILVGLLAVGGYFFYSNVLSSPEPGGGAAPRSAAASVPAVENIAAPARTPQASLRRAGSRGSSSEDFRPSLKLRPEDHLDPTAIDPTLRLDLLAKVQEVSLDGGARNVFQFATAPAPALPKGEEPKITPTIPSPLVKEAGPAGPPPPVPPPPITLKYYGYSTAKDTARKMAFFLDGEDILVAGEGDTVKKRYKVVSIGVNSVMMEDLVSKSRQPLALQPEKPG